MRFQNQLSPILLSVFAACSLCACSNASILPQVTEISAGTDSVDASTEKSPEQDEPEEEIAQTESPLEENADTAGEASDVSSDTESEENEKENEIESPAQEAEESQIDETSHQGKNTASTGKANQKTEEEFSSEPSGEQGVTEEIHDTQDIANANTSTHQDGEQKNNVHNIDFSSVQQQEENVSFDEDNTASSGFCIKDVSFGKVVKKQMQISFTVSNGSNANVPYNYQILGLDWSRTDGNAVVATLAEGAATTGDTVSLVVNVKKLKHAGQPEVSLRVTDGTNNDSTMSGTISFEKK